MSNTNKENNNLVSQKSKTKSQQKIAAGFGLETVTAKTKNQKKFFQSYKHYPVISLSGWAGTGKTFCALAQALKSVEEDQYKSVMIIRSAVSSRDIGFQPGNKKEKMSVYEGPYITICNKLYGRGDAYEILKQKNILKFESSSFLRGETFENTVVIVDEAQNMSWKELYTIMTRIGDNCKVIVCGDVIQDDLTSERFKENSGYEKLLHTFDLIEEDQVMKISFDVDDIVRSGFVKQFIIACNQ